MYSFFSSEDSRWFQITPSSFTIGPTVASMDPITSISIRRLRIVEEVDACVFPGGHTIL